ncbi:MAG TPA: hypothetical protein VFO65_12725 [Acidimicrobiales bacterium]|nr:hypothetical protein [Acidimicrobiales bacterium]
MPADAVVDSVGGWLAARSVRRTFLRRTVLVGAALALDPWRYLLRPGTAYDLIASFTLPRSCPPGSKCVADGYAEMCCTINGGVNGCPAGTIAGGWWKADGSIYCDGPRYYIDCVGVCSRCSTGCEHGFCPDCDSVPDCDCADGDCNNRRVGCRNFRYGQCHQEVGCVGRLSCRVVSCTPAWELDPSCTTTSATDNRTANHWSPCLDRPTDVPPVAELLPVPDGSGYYLVAEDGRVYTLGSAGFVGDARGIDLDERVVGAALAPGGGYRLVAAQGRVVAFGAEELGSTGGLNAVVVGMAATPSGRGYWVATADGGVFTFGDAPFLGSAGDLRLNRPVVGIAARADGRGYWLVASDGGIFSFGDAGFFGSTGSLRLNRPVVGMAATPTGRGYWLVASDGGIFTFGDADYYGSTGSLVLNHPIVSMAPTAKGDGYWLVARDGGVFAFGAALFHGSRVLPPGAG